MSAENGSRPSTGVGLKSIPLDPGLCRNVTIHGYCKWQDKGCKFYHGESKTPEAISARLRPETPTFHPGSSLSASLNVPSFSPLNSSSNNASLIGAGAPVFVPRGVTNSPSHNFLADSATQSALNSPSRSTAAPSSPASKPPAQVNPYLTTDAGLRSTNTNVSSPHLNPYETPTSDVFFQSRTSYQPLQYHLYSSLPPNRKSLARNERTAHDFFLNDNLRESLTQKQAAALQTVPNSTLPASLHSYHTLVPLDVHIERSDRVFRHPSTVYKAFCRQDGATYALRRVEGFKLVNEASIGLVEKWRRLNNANVVVVKEAFTSKSFADDSIIFVHEYHPLSSTLYDLHYNRTTRKFSGSTIIGEKLIWSYLTQLFNGLRGIHAMGLACRVIDATKILVTEKNRLRINCCGVLDVINYQAMPDMAHLQALDVFAIGKLILNLAMNDSQASRDPEAPFDLTQRGYSSELNKLITDLLRAPGTGETVPVGRIITELAMHSMQNLDSSLAYNDTLESELARETENGRLVRLLCKFGFINERPEYDHDAAWSETGERHVLKLFRDFVFHQVDDHGKAVIDLGHVLSCLNKLDAGVEERISLVSRDEQTCIIVTYKEVKRCAEQAWYSLIQTQPQHKNGSR